MPVLLCNCAPIVQKWGFTSAAFLKVTRRKPHMPLDSLVKIFPGPFPLPRCLCLHHLYSSAVTSCLLVFFFLLFFSLTCRRIHPHVIPEWPFSVILCHSHFIFSQCVPLFYTTIKPFHASLKFPGPPPRSRPFSICLSPSSFCSLPLCSAHLQHIKIPLFFLQRIVQSLGDLLHSSMFSLLFSPYLSP